MNKKIAKLIPENHLKFLDWSSLFDKFKHFIKFQENIDFFSSAPPQLAESDLQLLSQKKLHLISEHFEQRWEFSQSSIQKISYGMVDRNDRHTSYFDMIGLMKKSAHFTLAELNLFYIQLELMLNFIPLLNKFWNFSPLPLPLIQLLKQFRALVSEQGEIFYHKHPKLEKLINGIADLEVKIKNQIQHLIRSYDQEGLLQNNSYDIMNDHFVLFVRADHYRHQLGSILHHSNTGQTLYVEPHEIKDLVQQRMMKRAELEEELNRLAIMFRQDLAPFSHFLYETYDLLLELEKFYIRIKTNALFELQQSIEISPNITLENLWHPLIENPVKNSFSLDVSLKGFILSGPNTGGKTVFLKSVCLSFIFRQFGFGLPAHYGELPIVNSIYFFSSDNQDIKDGLSSFSAEVKQYLEVISNLPDNSLLFFDEIFNTTDSYEASALAMGIIEYLELNSHSRVFLSTHHQHLKTLLHNNQNYLNGHVGYDLERNQPTYKVFFDGPGSSLAFLVFEGLIKKYPQIRTILAMAEKYKSGNAIEYEKLLNELNHKITQAYQSEKNYQALIAKTEKDKKVIEGELYLKFENKIQQKETEFQKLTSRFEKLLKELEHSPDKSKRHYLNERSQILKDLQQTLEQTSSHLKLSKPSQILVNQTYFSQSLNANVKVIQIENQKAQVTLGLFKKELPLNDLFSPISQPQNKNFTKKSIASEVDYNDISTTVDARGMRLEEFQEIIDRCHNALLLEHVPYISVIHGHGDGVLKKWLREYYKESKDIYWEVENHSHDGSTLLKLK
jgi:DNA mismatch repair protein MutS2